MDFMTAVKTCFSKYVDFNGRARRSEFWFFVLFTFIVGIVTGILDSILGLGFGNGNGVINTVASLALLLPQLAVGARRLHDTGRSGWWQAIGVAGLVITIVVPILGILVLLVSGILLIVWFCLDSNPGDNKYGPNPKSGAIGGYPPPPPPSYGTGQYNG